MKLGGFLLTLVGSVVVLGFVYFTLIPEGRSSWNRYWHKMQKVDDATLYQTRKGVEDNCRAMMASYEADVLVYNQYKDSQGEERSWGQNAKMRANKTAASYNNYMMKNNYVWKDNVPEDIRITLKTVE